MNLIYNYSIMNNNYLDGVDVIYWINLDRETERKKYMEKIYQDPVFNGKKIKRISAIDAKNTKQLFDMLDLKIHKMRDAEYACLVSHLETIREFSKSNYETALIFEDDLSLEYKSYWKKSIQEIIKDAPQDWEILKLCCQRTKPYKQMYTKWVHLKGYKDVDNDVSSLSYLINKKGAKKLMKDLYHNNKYVLDDTHQHQSDGLLYQKLKTYAYKYPLFTYRNNNDTQIQLHKPRYSIKKNITRFLKKTRKNYK